MVDSACRPVLVLGTHRSGTSSVAAFVHGIGVPLRDADGLVPASSSNPRGHWEDQRLVDINTELLRAAGGTAVAPPTPSDWIDHFEVPKHLQTELVRLVTSGPRSWLAKDPRLCLTLPLWQAAMDTHGAIPSYLFVIRNPAEVAASLYERDGIPHDTGLAIWLRANHSALVALHGQPVFVIDYERFLDDPTSWGVRIQEFIASVGALADGGGTRMMPDPALRHHRGVHAVTSAGLSECLTLYALILEHLGANTRMDTAPSPEPAWCTWVLGISTPLMVNEDRMALEVLRVEAEFARYRESVERWLGSVAPASSRRRALVRLLLARLRPDRHRRRTRPDDAPENGGPA